MAAMKYKDTVFIILVISLLLSSPLAHSSSSTNSFFWLGETEDMQAMKKEKEIEGGRANDEVEERQVPTGSDPLHHNHIPFTSSP